jgi:hypothetical protein
MPDATGVMGDIPPVFIFYGETLSSLSGSAVLKDETPGFRN